MSLLPILLFLGMVCLPLPGRADDGLTLSGQVSEEGGLVQFPGAEAQSYQYGRLLVRGREEFDREFTLGVEGEAAEQSSGTFLAPLWLVPPRRGIVPVEADSPGDISGSEPAMARLDRAFLKWASGRLELTAGLQSFDNGSTNFYSPTHYFDPLPPLAWTRDELLGSEGVNADCFLFDDLSLEGSARWLSGGTNEWVLRLIDRGIGLTATPSFAYLNGRDGVGVQFSGTFPDFQVRWEGVEWFENGADQLEWVGAIAALFDRVQWSLQALQDTTGEALGLEDNRSSGAFYLFASAQRDFTAQWKTQLAVVKSIDGGPWFFWPRVNWNFEDHWSLGFQSQWVTAGSGGPLSGLPSQEGLSLDYIF